MHYLHIIYAQRYDFATFYRAFIDFYVDFVTSLRIGMMHFRLKLDLRRQKGKRKQFGSHD